MGDREEEMMRQRREQSLRQRQQQMDHIIESQKVLRHSRASSPAGNTNN